MNLGLVHALLFVRRRPVAEWPRLVSCAFSVVALSVSSCAASDSIPSHCDGVTNTIDTCFLGQAFAECPGPRQPRAYCGATSPHGEAACVWVSNGCPFEAKDVPLRPDCSCAPRDCKTFELQPSVNNYLRGYGSSPWDRDRAASLTVDVQDLGDVATGVTCTACVEACDACGFQEFWVIRRAPGTIVIFISGKYQGHGTRLSVEIFADQRPLRASACWRSFTDSPVECEYADPQCAVRGFLTLDREPDVTDVAALQGKLEAEFADGSKVEANFGR